MDETKLIQSKPLGLQHPKQEVFTQNSALEAHPLAHQIAHAGDLAPTHQHVSPSGEIQHQDQLRATAGCLLADGNRIGNRGGDDLHITASIGGALIIQRAVLLHPQIQAKALAQTSLLRQVKRLVARPAGDGDHHAGILSQLAPSNHPYRRKGQARQAGQPQLARSTPPSSHGPAS